MSGSTKLHDTASISLLTGLPGSGKTLRIVQFIVDTLREAEKPDKDGNPKPPARIFVTNVNGLKIPGVTKWLDPVDWKSLPPGSTLVVDEAQDFFPKVRSGGPTNQERERAAELELPITVHVQRRRDAIREMSKIRHSGVRLLLCTQEPGYLDDHLLGLVGFHEHLLRMNGKDKTFIFRHNTVMENIRKPFKIIRNQYDHESWALPAEYFQYYESAEIHTMKYRMPALMKKALLLGPLSAVLAFGTWFFVFRDGYAHVAQGKADSEAKAGPAGLPTTSDPTHPTSTAQGKLPGVVTAADYAGNLTPLVAGVPWTAPAWVNRPVRSDPHVYCIASGAGLDAQGTYRAASVSCVTEQGTRFDMPEDRARQVARDGEPYNPFKEPASASRRTVDDKDGDQPGAAPVSAGEPVAIGEAAGSGQVASYGGIGYGPDAAR